MSTKSRIAATPQAASLPAVLTCIVAATSLLMVPALSDARQSDLSHGELSASVRTSVPASGGDLAPVLEQHSRRGGSGGGDGQAVPRGGSGGGSGGGAGGGGGTRSGGGSGGGNTSGGSAGGTSSGGSGGGTSTGGARTRGGSRAAPANGSGGGSSGTPTYSRPRDGRPTTGTAVERRGDNNGGSRANGGGTVVVGGRYYGGYYPWGWGGLGLGGYYGYYDPYGWGEPYPPSMGYGHSYDGALKLKVTPRQAEVLVDGYFAGAVDDYDGLFQRLRLEAGPHRIEIRLDGYAPLSFEVRIQPDRTVTYKGDLRQEER